MPACVIILVSSILSLGRERGERSGQCTVGKHAQFCGICCSLHDSESSLQVKSLTEDIKLILEAEKWIPVIGIVQWRLELHIFPWCSGQCARTRSHQLWGAQGCGPEYGPVSANQRPVFRSHDQSWPIRGQYQPCGIRCVIRKHLSTCTMPTHINVPDINMQQVLRAQELLSTENAFHSNKNLFQLQL